MTDPAAIHAQFADYRTVKSRGVLQLILEVDITKAQLVLNTLGFPLPEYSIDVAVAKLKHDWEIALERQEDERHRVAQET